MRLDREDAQVLFLAALHVLEKKLAMSTPASVADAIEQCFKGKKVRDKATRRRVSTIWWNNSASSSHPSPPSGRLRCRR